MSKVNGVSSRRDLFRLGWGTVAAAGISGALRPARAQSAGGSRALVCVYLTGGNDSNNMIVPLDSAEYAAYAAARGSLALERGSLLPIATRGGAAYGLHPALGELRDLYSAGKMAIVANMGGAPAGRSSRYHAPPELAYFPDGFLMPAWAARWAQETGSAKSVYTFRSGASFVAPGCSPTSGGQYENQGLRLAMESAGSRVRFPETAFGREMADVAALLRIGLQWGMSRQVVTATLSGFDTHSNQLERQQGLFGDLSQTLAAFRGALDEMGMADQVTVFTESEFSRTVTPNSSGGTEHAWGGHQLVIGGAVRGGDIYGEFPSFQAASDVWTPTMSRDQYGAELTRWAGASETDVHQLFPRARGAWRLGLFA
jgi:uncharacterized protein (DUF1501 family)